jgi:PAS domain S-box-containing protein
LLLLGGSNNQANPRNNTIMPKRQILALDFASIIEESLNEIYIFDAESLNFILVNQGARLNNGYSMDELRTMTPIDIKPGHDTDSFGKVIQPLVDDEQEKIQFNTVHQRKDGSHYSVEVHLQKRKFEKRDVFVAIILDITEREQTASDLELARSFLESAPDAMIVVDGDGKVQVANRQMVNLFGYSTEELASMNIDQFVPMRYRDDHSKHRAKFVANPRVRAMGSDLSLSGVTKDQREIPIEVSLSPIKSADGTFVAAAIRDISERKAIEDALLDSQEKLLKAKEVAEQATATKTQFLAAASHDLRQPLQALRLYLSALSNKIEDPKALQLSEKMHLSLDTMGQLLEALLDISMLESGSIEPEKRDFSLFDMLNRLVTASAPQAQQKDIALSTCNKDYLIHTDPSLLERIVENFITNALRYTDSGEVKVECIENGSYLTITVTDTGIGIPVDKIDRVFDEYYQLGNSVRDRRKGLGLGLSIVKHIAKLLDLTVCAESVLGKGSAFSVNVPLSNNNKINDPETESLSVDYLESAEPMVLIVDDDTVILDAMSEMLSSHNIRVETAENAGQAIEHIKSGLNPDLVISDFRMPGMTGVELIEQARLLLDREIPVVIMTGDSSFNTIKDSNIQTCTVLRKPIDMAQLVTLIESIN